MVVGGGTRIDAAKLWRYDTGRRIGLVAVPSLWGSGAEVSPVAVGPGVTKRIVVDPTLVPEARVLWPELADSVPAERVRWACGDAWAHAVEGFLSPLADDAVRADGAALLARLLALPLDRDARWFEASAAACALQARASVGLVHGLAHVLEPRLAAVGDPRADHARLCATLLDPVLAFDLAQSPKAAAHFARYGVDLEAVLAIAAALRDDETLRALRPHVDAVWPDVVRDRCTRTNAASVRASSRDALLAGWPA